MGKVYITFDKLITFNKICQTLPVLKKFDAKLRSNPSKFQTSTTNIYLFRDKAWHIQEP